MEQKGAWEWVHVSLDGSIDRFQALAGGNIPVLTGQELFSSEELDSRLREKGYFYESGVTLPVYPGGRQFILVFWLILA